MSSLFTARDVEFNSLLDSLGDSQTSRHGLILAPWGGGKTHFLLMAFHAAREKTPLNSQWEPVFLPGRAGFFSSFSCFLERVLAPLAGLPGGCGISQEEYRIVKGLFRNPAAQWEQARQLLEKFTRQSNKKILLCIDDFDYLLDFILHDPAASKLMASFFSARGCLSIIGTAVPCTLENKKFSPLLSRSFTTISLAPFKEEEALTVLEKMAALNSKERLDGQIQNNLPAIKTLFHFTRGNPRLTLAMYQALAIAPSFSPFRIFQRMLDILSPHYRFLIQNTPPKERKLLDTLLRDSQRVSPSELARRLGWEGKEVSVLLKRLINRGLLKKVRLEPKKSFYGAADPLFCSYYHMEHVKDLRGRSRGIINFLYIAHSREKYGEGNGAGGVKSGKAAVPGLFYLEPGPSFFSNSKISEAYKLLKEKKGDEAIKRIQDLLQNSGDDPEQMFSLLFLLGFAYSFKGEHQKAVDCYKKCLEKKPEDFGALNNMGCDYRFLGLMEKAEECFLRALKEKKDSPPSLANLGDACFHSGKYDEAADCFLRFEKNIQGGSLTAQLNGPMIQLIFETYFYLIKKMALKGKVEETGLFVEERLAFIRSLPANAVFPAAVQFFSGLAKPETALLCEKALESVKSAFPAGTADSLSPLTLALECLKSGKDEVLWSQNEEISDAAKLILGRETGR
ncbi:MAG: tetratricopeptide repeat protein [Nitrospinae bacterium]|nr:tetratricopeptide repeat protein [Nitrospinota bacterium]